jgi:intracellular multiplication protein IcmL
MGSDEFGQQKMTNAQPLSTHAPSKAQSALPPAPQKKPVSSEDRAILGAISAFGRLKKRVIFQTWTIAVLGTLLTILLPFTKPAPLYYAITPQRKVLRLVGLTMPNMTNRAVLSWATTSITEVMTMGFGDIAVRLPKQRIRFTSRGWETYIDAFNRLKIAQTFRQSQLVLTTVPSNTPVVVNQGVNSDNIYQWTVQMPVIMTYATNNNAMRKQRATVTLIIVRVPAEDVSSGIAIQNWNIE